MAFLQVNNVEVVGMSVTVPSTIEETVSIYEKWGDYDNFVATTGIERRRKSNFTTCSSDLCLCAAEKLIAELGWEKGSIDALVFVTQTPDYILPATSAILQQRLCLSESCYTLDISLGCSGWVYALSVISSLLQNGTMKRGLLLAGDTILKICSPEDKSTYPLFGDAGSATALEHKEKSFPLQFYFNTDGEGREAIIIRDGGYRNPFTVQSLDRIHQGEDIERSRLELELDGMNVFSFGISKAPKSVNGLLEHFNINKESVDCFTFHQANLFMNEKIRKKLKLPAEKVPYSLKDFGNTSCASIPLTLVSQRSDELRVNKLSHIGCGFGVGLSWGSVYFHTDNIKCPNLIEF